MSSRSFHHWHDNLIVKRAIPGAKLRHTFLGDQTQDGVLATVELDFAPLQQQSSRIKYEQTSQVLPLWNLSTAPRTLSGLLSLQASQVEPTVM